MSALVDLRSAARARLPSLPNMPAHRASALATWFGRMVNEHGSARVFEGLAAQIDEAGLGRELSDACRGFADEERRHGVLCGSVVEALGGEALFTSRDEDAFPAHDDVSAVEGVLRNLLSISCMSETVAVALIGAEREEMPLGELRSLLDLILADEIGHARFGWRVVSALVPTLGAAARARLSDYLEVAFAHVEAHELAHLPLAATPPPEAAALGLCRGDDARSLFYETLSTVIVPRLDALGLAASAAFERRAA